VWLVDGFNALHTVILGGEARREWWREPERQRLIERVRAFSRPGAEIWVVFDGDRTPPPNGAGDGGNDRGNKDEKYDEDDENDEDDEGDAGDAAETSASPATSATSPRLEVVFAPSADDWLVRRVRQADAAGRLAVVTADRKVAARCRHAGSAVIAPRDFLAHCGPQIED